MKKLENILLASVGISYLLALLVKNDMFYLIFVIITFIIVLFYSIGSYFLFKPIIKSKQFSIISILSGISFGLSIFPFIMKFFVPISIYKYYLFYILLVTILATLTVLYFINIYKPLKQYIARIFKRGFILLIVSLIFVVIPTKTFSKFHYKTGSFMEIDYSYKMSIKAIKNLIRYDKLDSALIMINKDISEYTDVTSYKHQNYILQKAKIFFYKKNLGLADIEINKILNIYKGYNNEFILEDLNEDYKETFFEANYLGGIINSALKNYTKSDSLFDNTFLYFKTNNVKSQIYNYKAYNLYQLGNLNFADSLIKKSMDLIPFYKYNSKLYLRSTLTLIKIRIKQNNFDNADYLLNVSLIIIDNKKYINIIDNLTREQKIQILTDEIYS